MSSTILRSYGYVIVLMVAAFYYYYDGSIFVYVEQVIYNFTHPSLALIVYAFFTVYGLLSKVIEKIKED